MTRFENPVKPEAVDPKAMNELHISAARRIPTFVVLGKTGAGKSSLIYTLGGRDKNGECPEVGEGIDSCTRESAIYVTKMDQKEMILLDIPGFDDSVLDNLKILRELSISLFRLTCEFPTAEIQGIIFLHDISEMRMGGSQRKTWEIVKALCGEAAMGNLIIGTTMWSEKTTRNFPKQERREGEFLEKQWQGIFKTIRVMEDDKESAAQIVYELLNKTPVMLRIQTELANSPDVSKTTAGKIATAESQAQIDLIQKQSEKLEESLRERDEIKRSMEQMEKREREEKGKRAQEKLEQEEKWRHEREKKMHENLGQGAEGNQDWGEGDRNPKDGPGNFAHYAANFMKEAGPGELLVAVVAAPLMAPPLAVAMVAKGIGCVGKGIGFAGKGIAGMVGRPAAAPEAGGKL